MKHLEISVTEYHDSEKRFLDVYFKWIRNKDECPLLAMPSCNILTPDMDLNDTFDPERFLSERGYVHFEDYVIKLPVDMEYIPSERITVLNDNGRCNAVTSASEMSSCIVENDRYDDFWYDRKPNGDLFCSGISMSSDLDSCYEFSRRHQECRKCEKYPH